LGREDELPARRREERSRDRAVAPFDGDESDSDEEGDQPGCRPPREEISLERLRPEVRLARGADLAGCGDPRQKHEGDHVAERHAGGPELEELRADQSGHGTAPSWVSSRKTSSSVARSAVSSCRT